MTKTFLSLIVYLAVILLQPEPTVVSAADSFTGARQMMLEEQLKRRGIRDTRVLQAMEKLKRELFVPAEQKPFAYADGPLKIGYAQTISQPYVVAYMTEALELKETDRVLEIGTGSGYQAAVLGELAAEVYSVEIVPELGNRARELLRELGYENIHLKIGDGYEGWAEHAPFDAMIVTAAPPEIPQALVDQLKSPGGRMIVPVGSGYQELQLLKKTRAGIKKEKLIPVRFVPMVKGNSQTYRKQE